MNMALGTIHAGQARMRGYYKAKSRSSSTQHGFTVVELMIATLVFSVILLLLTSAMIRLGRMYYKGLASTKVQEVSRSVIEDISQSIQFAGGDVFATAANGSVQGYCVGTRRYSFVPYQAYTAAGEHKLLSGTVPQGCVKGVTAARDMTTTLSGDEQELLGEDMRVVNLKIENSLTSGLYKVTVRIAYGKDDVLCSPTGSGCAPDVNHDNLVCRSGSKASQFCAVSEVTATVQRRVL